MGRVTAIKHRSSSQKILHKSYRRSNFADAFHSVTRGDEIAIDHLVGSAQALLCVGHVISGVSKFDAASNESQGGADHNRHGDQRDQQLHH